MVNKLLLTTREVHKMWATTNQLNTQSCFDELSFLVVGIQGSEGFDWWDNPSSWNQIMNKSAVFHMTVAT